MIRHDAKRHRFQIKLRPDPSTASLRDRNTPELFCPDHYFGASFFGAYRICEDTLVSFWSGFQKDYGVYTGLIMSANFSNVCPAVKTLFPDIGNHSHALCPASGRIVRLDARGHVAVLDFF